MTSLWLSKPQQCAAARYHLSSSSTTIYGASTVLMTRSAPSFSSLLTRPATAKHAEQMVIDGVELPPLHGVPTAIKDLYLTADMPTGFGTGAFPPQEFGIDEAVVTKLRAAGTISLGKTATPEFGATCYTEPEGHPSARTPWDLTCSAGGSSGGAGVAVAAGLLPAAPGSDGAGSIRIPASVNGLVGVKTSRGRVGCAA